MNHAFIDNGQTQLVLIPNNELESLLFKKLLEGEPEIIAVGQNVNLLDKTMTGGVIIRRKQKPVEAMLVPINNESTSREIVDANTWK